jgi:hypothetical protein
VARKLFGWQPRHNMTWSKPPRSHNKPRWHCRDRRDQDALEKWTNEQLDLLYNEPCDESAFSATDLQLIQELTQELPNLVITFPEEIDIKRKILAAIKYNDFPTVGMLMLKYPKLRRFAAKALTRLRPAASKPGRGRKRGEPRKKDIPFFVRRELPYVLKDIANIKAIWKREFGKKNRPANNQPTAIGIAARRNGLDEESLIVWLKNKRRALREFF